MASDRKEDFEAYLARYPRGVFASLALNRIGEIANTQVAARPPATQPVPDLTIGTSLIFSNGIYRVRNILSDRIEVSRDRNREDLLFGIIRVGRGVLQKDHKLSVTSREMRKLSALFPLQVGRTVTFRMRDVFDGNDHIDNIKVELRVLGRSTFVSGALRLAVWDLRGDFKISAPGSGNAANIARTYKYSPDLFAEVDDNTQRPAAG